MGDAGRHILGGWQLNGIVQTQTGFPFTVIDATATGIQFLTNRPNLICDPNEGAPHTTDQWFNTECFQRRSLPETAGLSSQGRNEVRGPGFWRTDLSLFKNITLTGTHRVQLRVEAFNLLNQERFFDPGRSAGAATFGRITQAEDGRVVQLAIKYSF